MGASRRLHRNLLVNVMHLPMSFFDTTPVGRIVNRFSKDLYTIDDTIPRCVTDFMWCSLEIIGMIVAISYATPLFLATLPVVAIFYLYIQVSESRRKESLGPTFAVASFPCLYMWKNVTCYFSW